MGFFNLFEKLRSFSNLLYLQGFQNLEGLYNPEGFK